MYDLINGTINSNKMSLRIAARTRVRFDKPCGRASIAPSRKQCCPSGCLRPLRRLFCAPAVRADDARSPFLRALPASAHSRVPAPMLAFHVSGGICRGPLLVERGQTWLGRLLATLGQLPHATPPAAIHAPEDVEVTSVANGDGSGGGDGGVAWTRQFPGMAGPLMSRWYYDEASQLAVDSFAWRGITDFAAFGFVLEPVEAEPQPGTAATVTSGASMVGFRHVTKQAWVLGLPLPKWLAMSADGVSLPHADGLGWDVEVEVAHPLVGKVVSYRGSVRLDPPEKGTEYGKGQEAG